MEINTSVQLGIEQALVSLIPYLQSLADATGYWDFLDVFPPLSSTTFLYLAGHEAKKLPDDKVGYLGFIAGLPDNRSIGPRYPKVSVKMDLATAGIGDEKTRQQAILTHSQRTAALIRLFSQPYSGDSKNPGPLREVLLLPASGPDNRPWKGLGFDAWNAELPESGQSANGNAFIASPTYLFIVHFETAPQI
jgi:hypothetical protein